METINKTKETIKNIIPRMITVALESDALILNLLVKKDCDFKSLFEKMIMNKPATRKIPALIVLRSIGLFC